VPMAAGASGVWITNLFSMVVSFWLF